MISLSSARTLPVRAAGSRAAPALAAIAVGLLIVFSAGFAAPAAVHNATHDTRHAFGLPCH
jgi:cobalt transporter subunit CbtB